jgi:cellulose synthase operon protein C
MKSMKDPMTHSSRQGLKLSALVLSLALLAGCDSAEEKAQAYYDRAMSTMAAGDLDKAALDFRNALKLDENYADAQWAPLVPEMAQLATK